MLLATALAVGCGGPSPGGEAGRREPVTHPAGHGANVVLISIDTLRADRLGSYGYERPTSPALDALAAKSIRFENAYAESSWTLPSHITLFTGLHPSSHGVVLEEDVLPDELPTLTERLQSAGYQTIGLTAGGLLSGRYGFSRGFDRFEDRYRRLPRMVERAQQAILETSPDRPFFLFLHTYDVHCPYDPPERYALEFRTRPPEDHLEVEGRCGNPHFNRLDLTPGQIRFLSDQYDAGIRAADDQLARFFGFLEERGLWDRTIVAVVSDHGEELGEHGRIGHERTLFIESLEVPAIVKVPGMEPRVVDAPVGLRHLAPTLLDLTGHPGLSDQAFSLLPAMLGGSVPHEPSPSELDRHVTLRSIIRGDHHLIADFEGAGAPMLFDLSRDPREQNDLIDSREGRRIARELARLLTSHLRGLPPPPAEVSKPLDPELEKELEALGYL